MSFVITIGYCFHKHQPPFISFMVLLYNVNVPDNGIVKKKSKQALRAAFEPAQGAAENALRLERGGDGPRKFMLKYPHGKTHYFMDIKGHERFSKGIGEKGN